MLARLTCASSTPAATIFARIDRHEEIGVAHDRFGAETDATAADHHACSCAGHGV